MEVVYEGQVPDTEALKEALRKDFPETHIQSTGENGILVRTVDLSGDSHAKLLEGLSLFGKAPLTEKQSSSIGPTIGKELRSKAWFAILAVIFGIVLFIAFAFRGVSKPISSWRYGFITLVALAHDIIIPAGLFVYLGKEINSLFVVALLSILGISVHDKIVVFDRIRENLRLHANRLFDETVGKSLVQTFARSVNTSLTILIVLGVLWYMGPESTRDFAMLLFAGVAIGTYSSVFFAAPLLVFVEKLQKKSK